MSDETFGRWLGRTLKARHMSQTTLARELGVAKNTVSRWVTDTRRPHPETMEEVAAVLGVPLDEVLVAARLLPGARAEVGPRARLRDVLAVMPDEEIVEFSRWLYERARSKHHA